MDEPEMREVASIVGDALSHADDDAVKDKARARVLDLMGRFPAYP